MVANVGQYWTVTTIDIFEPENTMDRAVVECKSLQHFVCQPEEQETLLSPSFRQHLFSVDGKGGERWKLKEAEAL